MVMFDAISMKKHFNNNRIIVFLLLSEQSKYNNDRPLNVYFNFLRSFLTKELVVYEVFVCGLLYLWRFSLKYRHELVIKEDGRLREIQ